MASLHAARRKSTLSIRHRLALGALGAALLALGATDAVAQALEKTKISLAVGGKNGLYYLPLTIAERLGYFKDEGLDVEISDFAGGAKSLEALVGGSVDVVAGAYEHTINMQVKGQHIRAFALMGRSPAISIGVATDKAKDIKGPKDLKGLKFGVSAPGSSTNIALNTYLAKGGLKPSDVAVIGVGSTAGSLAAFRSGQIDAMSNVEPVMTMLEQKGDVKILASSRTPKGTEEMFGGAMPAATLYAYDDFLKKNPNTAQALANAIVRADKWLAKAGPSDVVKTVPESYQLGDKALYLAAFNAQREAFSPDGLMPDSGPATAVKVLASFDPKIDPAKVKLADTWTNDFAKRANLKYK
jgi:NitT/TauT family transport system substrate-binding protein